mmetsp:Transcript_48079/g.75089  ORF Transcript_48079/g.75089 Transcript_48079/m.75089 type:complete len:89 (-) Transcript_48079:149-415(-)
MMSNSISSSLRTLFRVNRSTDLTSRDQAVQSRKKQCTNQMIGARKWNTQWFGQFVFRLTLVDINLLCLHYCLHCRICESTRHDFKYLR